MNTTTNTAAHVEALNTALKNGNNTVNQKIKGDFIDQHVNMCVSYLMEELFKASPYVDRNTADLPNYEDVENLYFYPEYNGTHAQFEGGSYEELQTEIERLKDLMLECTEDEDETTSQIEDEIQALEDLESEPQEVYEWWAVSEYLFEKLKAQGAPVLEYANMYIWGRCTAGQAILLDYAITKICAEMEILEGQSNPWAK